MDTDKLCTQVGLHLSTDKNVCIVYDQSILSLLTTTSSDVRYVLSKVSACRWTSSAWMTVWNNKQHSDNVPQLAVHLFASHGLMHQDIHSRLGWVKIHKLSHSLSIMEARSAGAEFHPLHFQLLCYTALTGAIQTSDVSCSIQCNEYLHYPGQQSHFSWLFHT